MSQIKNKILVEIEIDEEEVKHSFTVENITYYDIIKKLNDLSIEDKASTHEPVQSLKKEIPPQIDANFSNVWYRTPNGWRLLTDDFSMKSLPASWTTLNIQIHTLEYLRQNRDIGRLLEVLQKKQKTYKEQSDHNKKLLENNERHDRTPKISFLYACPICQDDPTCLSKSIIPGKNHYTRPGVFAFTTNYLKTFNKIATVLQETKQELRLEVMEFNKSNFRQSLSSKIVYVMVHAEDTKNFIFGEDRMGRVVEIRYNEKDKIFIQQTDLLIIHSSCNVLPYEFLEKSAKNIILINSNVLFEDDTVEAFIGKLLYELLAKQTPIKQAFIRSRSMVEHQEHLNERLMCCCFHIHDPTVCHRQKSTNQRYNKFHYRYHKIRCNCEQRFEMIHLDDCEERRYFKKEDLKFHYNKESLCCCCDSKMPEIQKVEGKEDIHSLKFKFMLKEGADGGMTVFSFKKGTLTPNISLKPYKDAMDRGYGRMGNWQKKYLAMAMWYRNDAVTANSHRFILNLYGPDGSGRSHMRKLIINYLQIKREIDFTEFKVNDIKQWTHDESKIKAAQVIDIENATPNDPNLRKLLQSITHKIVILVSTERIEIEGMEIKNMLLKPYNPEEAYDLIVRKLQKRKLKRWEKDKLIERLRSIPWQYASFIVREVPKIEDNNIDDYLKQNLKFDQVPHPIKNDNIKEYQALIVISQFEKLSQRSCRALLSLLNICEDDSFEEIVFKRIAKRSEDNKTITAVCNKPKFVEFTEAHIKQIFKPLVRELLGQANELTAEYNHRFNQYKLKQRLFDCTTRNEHSVLSIFMRTGHCRFKNQRQAKSKIDIDELYQFIKENFGSETYTPLIYPQIVYLCMLVINLKLMESPYDKYMSTILRNIAKLRDQKPDKATDKIQKNLLRIVVNETAIQINFAKRLSQQQGKEAVQRDTVISIEKSLKDIIKWKDNLSNLLDKDDRYLLAVIQFDILLIVVICETNNQPPKQIEEDDIQKIEDFLVAYDKAQSDITNPDIIKDHAIRKEFVRLLLTGNPQLRLYNNINIRQHLNGNSDLMVFYEFLQNRLKCTSLSSTTIQNLEDHEKLEMLNQFIQTYYKCEELLLDTERPHSRLSTRSQSTWQDQTIKSSVHDLQYQPPLRNKGFSMASPIQHNKKSFPAYFVILVTRFRDHLKRQISSFLETTAIFTLLTSYPVKIHKDDCPEKRFGVTIQFDLKKKLEQQKAHYQNIILEHKTLDAENLRSVLKRGSKYVCLWFQYKSARGDDEVILQKTDQYENYDYEVSNINELIEAKSQFGYRTDTLFVCGNSKIGQMLWNQGYCASVVSFKLNSQDHYSFYIKNVFQLRVVEFFMSKFLQNITINLAQAQFFEQNLPDQFLKLREKISIKYTPKDLKKSDQYKRDDIVPIQINYMSPKVYIMKINDQLFDIVNFKNLRKKAVAIFCQDKQMMGHFVGFYKNFCENKQTFPDEVYIVDWDQMRRDQQPVLFVDRIIGCKLTVMAARTSLVIMKNYSTLIADDKRSKSMKTLPRLIEILGQQQNKMLTIICKYTQKDTYSSVWSTQIKLEKGSFKLLEPHNKDIIPRNDFEGKK